MNKPSSPSFSALSKTLFTLQTSSLTPRPPHRGGLGGLAPPGLISAKHLSHSYPVSHIISNITSSTVHSVAPKSLSFTPFFARFPAYSRHPAKLYCQPKNSKSILRTLLLDQYLETFISDVLPDSASFACHMHFSDPKSAGGNYLKK